MGNRAIITDTQKKIGIYLHWNGGPESVHAFLKYAQMHVRRGDSEYGMARLTQIIANFFGGYLSVGLTPVTDMNLHQRMEDNGVYIIDDQFEVVERLKRGRGSINREIAPEAMQKEKEEAMAHPYWNEILSGKALGLNETDITWHEEYVGWPEILAYIDLKNRAHFEEKF